MPRKQLLSAVVLAYNAEEQIENCLKSLAGWADEIVVVDGFSSDATIEICKKYGAKIVQHYFAGDFAEERNIGTDNSSGDWILQLDTDEVVTGEFKKELGAILNSDTQFKAYKFLRKNNFMGHFMKYGGWEHYSLHFFKKGFARYQGMVHETLVVDGEIGVINFGVEHYPFKNFHQFIERQNRYTSLEAKQIIKDRGASLGKKEVFYNMKIKPLKRFWKFYVKKQGYRDGIWGFIFSVLFAWVHFIKWVKVWEIQKDAIS